MGRDYRRLVVSIALALAVFAAVPIFAQDGVRVFPETDQSLDNQYGFLQFWEQHGGEELLGPPLTGIVFEANVPVQYFLRGRLEFRDGVVTPGQLGRERTRWRNFAPEPAQRSHPGSQFFAETGHALEDAFLQFWRAHDGTTLFGPPISGPLWEVVDGASVRVQYFERARLEEMSSAGGGGIRVGALGQEIARARGLILPEQRPALAVIDPEALHRSQSAFAALAPPTPTPIPPTPTPIPPSATPAPLEPMQSPSPTPSAVPEIVEQPAVSSPAGKLIAVDISDQRLVAYEDGQVVYEAPVATGKDGFDTPIGEYAIYQKRELQTMRGDMNGESWTVPNVPNIMYFNGSVALHGTYWHNNFGTGIRMSHGCVNLSLADAAWMYGWAETGTPVLVEP